MSRILLSQADVTSVEEEYVLDALRSGWVTSTGPHVDAFESEVAHRVGVATIWSTVVTGSIRSTAMRASLSVGSVATTRCSQVPAERADR